MTPNEPVPTMDDLIRSLGLIDRAICTVPEPYILKLRKHLVLIGILLEAVKHETPADRTLPQFWTVALETFAELERNERT